MQAGVKNRKRRSVKNKIGDLNIITNFAVDNRGNDLSGRVGTTKNNMQIEVLKSKIHRVTITQANLSYVGSITIDEDLLDAANLIAGEKVQIVNVNNGERIETYIIKGERGSGAVCLNGPAARRCVVGDVIIIISYAMMDFEEAKTFKPWVVFPDTQTNRLIK